MCRAYVLKMKHTVSKIVYNYDVLKLSCLNVEKRLIVVFLVLNTLFLSHLEI